MRRRVKLFTGWLVSLHLNGWKSATGANLRAQKEAAHFAPPHLSEKQDFTTVTPWPVMDIAAGPTDKRFFLRRVKRSDNERFRANNCHCNADLRKYGHHIAYKIVIHVP